MEHRYFTTWEDLHIRQPPAAISCPTRFPLRRRSGLPFKSITYASDKVIRGVKLRQHSPSETIDVSNDLADLADRTHLAPKRRDFECLLERACTGNDREALAIRGQEEQDGAHAAPQMDSRACGRHD